MNDFEAIKEQTDITQFIVSNAGGDVKRVGSNVHINPCPICGHNDCLTPFQKTKTYKCFSCGSGGSLFNFVEDYFKISDNYQKLLKAAELTGYALTNSNDVKKESGTVTARKDIFNKAASYYHHCCTKSKAALDILRTTRKYSVKTVDEFMIGYSGDTWSGLYDHLKADYDDKTLLASGLVVQRKKGEGLRDAFLPKMFIFPHYLGRQVVDFSCKDSLKHEKEEKDVIKQRLTAEHRLAKNIWFYNQDALYYDDIIIVEGEHDAIQLMRCLSAAKDAKNAEKRAIKKNVLAITGNPSGDAIKYLQRMVKDKNVYLGFDQDRAKSEKELSAGDKYRREFFLHLWGIAASIKVITWDGGAKDIDEYLRSVLAA